MANQVRSTTDGPSADSFLPRAENDDGPVISAAGNPDSAVLHALLRSAEALSPGLRSTHVLNQVHDEGLDGRWDTPLLRAIAEKRVENVRLLLRYGANPNGIGKVEMASYARRFRRLHAGEDTGARRDVFIVLREEDVGGVAKQILPFNEAEMAASREGISPFWAGEECPDLDLSTNGDLLHSLVMAARLGTAEIYEMLAEAGADVRFWLRETAAATELFTDVEEIDLDPSALCLSTPLHAAITAGSLDMLRALLANGLSPNARALLAGSRALTPMQHAIVMGNLDAYATFAAHPQADTNLLTPGFGVHILHFAVAYLMPEQLISLNIPLSDAPVTALSHTLLHIASLSLDESSLQTLAPRVRQSLHFIRRSAYLATEAPVPSEDPKIQQIAMCKHLISSLGAAELSQTDAHGNTPLHYLAGASQPHEELIEWMKAQESGEGIWRNSRNLWGFTPEDLWCDARAVVIGPPGNGRGRGGRGRGR